MVRALMKMKHFEKIRISPIIITTFAQCFGTSRRRVRGEILWILHWSHYSRKLSNYLPPPPPPPPPPKREKGVSSRILWQAWLIRIIFNPFNPTKKIWILICCPYSFPTKWWGEVDKISSKFTHVNAMRNQEAIQVWNSRRCEFSHVNTPW